jgi:serine/threonine-protein kinase
LNPRGRKALRLVGRAAYAAALGASFLVAAYLAFSLMVRSGVVKVPDVVGLEEAAAIERLAGDGLVGRRALNEVFDPAIDAGRVARQSPDRGGFVKRGAEIELAISLGKQLVRMPELRGQPLPSAEAALRSVALELGAAPAVYPRRATEPPGTVIDQKPEGGGYVDRARPVVVYVGLDGGPSSAHVMPDFIARGFEQSRAVLEARGVRLGNVKVEPYEGAPGGIVLRQFPLPGHPLRPHDAVSLVISAAGPATT